MTICTALCMRPVWYHPVEWLFHSPITLSATYWRNGWAFGTQFKRPLAKTCICVWRFCLRLTERSRRCRFSRPLISLTFRLGKGHLLTFDKSSGRWKDTQEEWLTSVTAWICSQNTNGRSRQFGWQSPWCKRSFCRSLLHGHFLSYSHSLFFQKLTQN